MAHHTVCSAKGTSALSKGASLPSASLLSCSGSFCRPSFLLLPPPPPLLPSPPSTSPLSLLLALLPSRPPGGLGSQSSSVVGGLLPLWQELAFSSGLAPGPQGWAPRWVPGSSSLKVPTSWESWSLFARAGLCPGPGAVGTPSLTHPPWWLLDSTLPARKDEPNSRAGKVGGSAIASENEGRRESPPAPVNGPLPLDLSSSSVE